MEVSDDTIRNRIRDLPDCSAVPQPTALPRAPIYIYIYIYIYICRLIKAKAIPLQALEVPGG